MRAGKKIWKVSICTKTSNAAHFPTNPLKRDQKVMVPFESVHDINIPIMKNKINIMHI